MNKLLLLFMLSLLINLFNTENNGEGGATVDEEGGETTSNTCLSTEPKNEEDCRDKPTSDDVIKTCYYVAGENGEENSCKEKYKNCDELTDNNSVTPEKCSHLLTEENFFCIIKEGGGGCTKTNECLKVKEQANEDICQGLRASLTYKKCILQGSECVETEKSCAETGFDVSIEICEKLIHENENICYFDGEKCEQASKCEDIEFSESLENKNDLCDKYTTETMKCKVSGNMCIPNKFCEGSEFVSENDCSSFEIITAGYECTKGDDNKCHETPLNSGNTSGDSGNSGNTSGDSGNNGNTSGDSGSKTDGNSENEKDISESGTDKTSISGNTEDNNPINSTSNGNRTFNNKLTVIILSLIFF